MTTDTKMFTTTVVIKATGQVVVFWGFSHHAHALDFIAKATV